MKAKPKKYRGWREHKGEHCGEYGHPLIERKIDEKILRKLDREENECSIFMKYYNGGKNELS